MSRAQNGPDYDFGPYEDEYRGFEIRDDESGRGPLILILALGVLLIFAGVVWNTYRQGVRPAEGGLPVIASDDAPYKRSPDERGGLEVAGQDKGYYDSMDGLGDPAMQQAAARDPVDIRRRATPTLEGGPLPPIEQSDDTSNTELADTSEPTVEPASDDQQIRIAAVQPVTPATRPQAPAVSAPSVSRFAASGAYQVQLAALRSETAAQTAWTGLQDSAPDLFAGAKLDIQRADLGARGVFYRLRVGTFSDRAAAKGFCEDVKAAGKDCMVVAKASG
ncbi:MAG: SPOR domain-containing protein [Hyphomonas sp.]|nr:SPOR domain-containing protein [Hyphomonas sp.]